MTDTLRPLPCPFCGREAIYEEFEHMVLCSGDGCGFGYSGEGMDTPELIAAWNRRPNSERDRLRDAVVEAGKNVDANDGMDEEWKLRYALRALAAFESSQKEG